MFALSVFLGCPAPAPAPEAPAGAPAPAVAHTLLFTNSCLETVWVGSYSQNGAPAIGGGGWALTPGQTMRLDVPVGSSGRIWPRTGCAFADEGKCPTPGVDCCKTGGCLTRDGTTFGQECAHTGEPPATLVEWTLDAPSGNGPIDTYDVSAVDGWSVPVSIRPVAGSFNPEPDPGMDAAMWCGTGAGIFDAETCPEAYRVEGSPSSCWSPCAHAKRTGAADAAKLCCTCSFAASITCPDPACEGGYGCTPYHDPAYPAGMTCDPWSKDASRAWDATAISYIDAVRKVSPHVYSWPFDDAAATYHCRRTEGLADYAIEFCPAAPTPTPAAPTPAAG